MIPNLNSVVMSSRDGKIENSSGDLMHMLISRIIRDMEIFIMIMTSSKNGLSGIISSSTIITTNSATELLSNLFIIYFIYSVFFFSLYTYTRISATAL